MKKTSSSITVSSVVGAALLCLMPQAAGFAQSYSIRPTCNSSGQCKPNTATFGFNDTSWRQWPVQPRPEETNSKTIGGTVLPTPPAIPEKALPPAEIVPAKPPISGGTTGGQILPPFGPGSTPELKTDGGTATVPGKAPAGITPPASAPKGSLTIPDGLDLTPLKPDIAPKPESGVQPLVPPTGPGLPGGIMPEKLTPPETPAPQPPKTPDKDVSTPALPIVTPDLAPTLAPKPDQPSPAKPNKGSSLSRPRKDAVAERATAMPNDLPMQANWNAALEPESLGDNNLRSTSFEQRTSATGNPLRCALAGYCPVQLKEHDRWIAGAPNFQVSYEGQVFHFSSDAARQQFEAAPEKYAPAHSGNDVVLAVKENRTVPGSVNHSAVWHGRLYLFSNAASLTAFQEDPARYAHGQRQTALQTPASSL